MLRAMMKEKVLILGSASPRRAKILSGLGCVFRVAMADAAEIHDASDPVRTVADNALAKYLACRLRNPDCALITADTLVWFAGRLIGKPRDLAEAAVFLREFSGRVQTVYTGLALGLPGREPDIRVEASSVKFKVLSPVTIEAYLAKTRPLDRAGANDIDENGDLLIESYSGSYTNIMGLPRETVRDWLCGHGLMGLR